MQETDAVSSPEELGRRLTRLQLQLDRQAQELAMLRQQLATIGTPPRPRPIAAITQPLPPPPLPPKTPPPPVSEAPRGVPVFAAVAAPQKAGPQRSVENRLGGQLFMRIGILVLLIAASLALKFAYDQGWLHVSPIGRIVSGLVIGAGVILWSERFRSKGYTAYSYSMKAIGTGTLYLTLWASFQIYHLLPAGVALSMMIGVTAWNAAMAWLQDSELLAAYALIGGFASPALLRSGGNHETFLFTYILALDAAVLFLVMKKPWQRLLLGAFPGTVIYFIGWYTQFWSPAEALATGIFSVLLALPFIALPLVGLQRDDVYEGALAPLVAASFLACTLYSVLEDSGHHAWLAWASVLGAVLYLLIMRLRRNGLAEAVHLVIAIVLLTIAVPLKASGRWITIGWLTEGAALLWASASLLGPAVQVRVRHTLRALATCALSLGVVESLIFWSQQDARHAFWNARFATELAAVAALALAARIATHTTNEDDNGLPSWPVIRLGATLLAHVIAPLALCRELAAYWTISSPGQESYHVQLSSLSIGSLLAVYAACLLAWLALRKRPVEPAVRTILFTIAACYLILGAFDTAISPSVASAEGMRAFANSRLVFEVITVAALALSAWFGRMTPAAHTTAEGEGASWPTLTLGTTLIGHVLAVIAIAREIATAWATPVSNDNFAVPISSAYHDQLRTLSIGALLLCYGAALLGWVAWRSSARSTPQQRAALRVLGSIYLVFGYMPVVAAPLMYGGPTHSVLNARLGIELVTAAALGFAAWTAWRKRSDGDVFWGPTAAVTFIGFNFLILLAGMHEIFTWFGSSSADATLAEAFSVSAWLMLYAAVLLAAGFWKKMAFVRWQGLALLVFTILKVFLYDTHTLSSGYRILSFFGLGLVLMVVSFAYQRDWLQLRDAASEPAEAAE